MSKYKFLEETKTCMYYYDHSKSSKPFLAYIPFIIQTVKTNDHIKKGFFSVKIIIIIIIIY